MLKTLTAAAAAFLATSAVAADLPVQAPQTRIVQDDCAYVEVKMHNWSREAIFRVTAVGGQVTNGWVQTPVKLPAGGTRLCIPRAFFVADIVEICIGDTSKDNSNSRLIQNNWMRIARANLAKGNTVNPGQPMNFRYRGGQTYAGTLHQRVRQGSSMMRYRVPYTERRSHFQKVHRMMFVRPHQQMRRTIIIGPHMMRSHHARSPIVARQPHRVRPHIVY